MFADMNSQSSDSSRENSKPFSIKHKVNKFLFYILEKFLPTKTKRLIFLSSLIASANSISNPSKNLLNEINNILNISNTDKAIALPMMLGSELWNNKLNYRLKSCFYKDNFIKKEVTISTLQDHHLNVVELRIIANKIISCSPAWLIYDSKKNMRSDIVIVLNSLNKFSEINKE